MKKLLQSAILLVVLTLTLTAASHIQTYAKHTATVQWSKEPRIDDYAPHPGDASQYYWNGYTPKWVNFTVTNNGPDPIREVKVVFQKDENGNSYFNFTNTNQPSGWYATPDEFGQNKKPTVIYFRTDTNPIPQGKTYRFDIYMTEGPKKECSYNIDVWTVDSGSPATTNYYELFILIDRTLPKVKILTPANGTVYKDGDTIWINATAEDKEGLHPSKIKKVELWFTNITKKGKSEKFIAILKNDTKRNVLYWRASPGTPEYTNLTDEAWHNITLVAYDYAENLQTTKQQQEVMFFWFKPKPPVEAVTIDKCFLENQPVGHVGSNVKLSVRTGFPPYTKITVKLGTVEVGSNTTDAYGQFSLTFQVPELPRGTYDITVTDGKITNTTKYTIIPWVWIDKTEGFVDDEVTITGKGFAANTEIDVIYRDVGKGRYFDSWAVEWDEIYSESLRLFYGVKLEWRPYLDNLTLTKSPLKTDSKGSFTFKFRVPQSYGGYHPIFGVERKTGVRSGWMPKYPQGAFFKVKTKIWTEPAIGLSGQFIRINGTGLPLPLYTEKVYDCITKKTSIQVHNYTLVIDFGQNRQWIFEKGFILNNEFDFAWFNGFYFPIAYRYPPDVLRVVDPYPDPKSPVWNGTLCWRDSDRQYHIGSPFLKVPALTAEVYDVTLYQFNVSTGKDVKKHEASTKFQVLKDPLTVRVNTGTLYFSGETVKVYAQIELDGKLRDPTTINFSMYRENMFIQNLPPEKFSTGLYAASFTCPKEKGNYIIIVNVSLKLDSIVLTGVGAAAFTVSPTLEGFNATLTGIKGDIATIRTNMGQISLNISSINAKIIEVKNGIATIQTDLGEVKAEISSISAKITSINDGVATIRTELGEIKATLNDINGKIVKLDGDTAVIKTDIETVKTSLEDIKTNIIAVGQNVVKVETILGDVQGRITSIDGKTATITTSVGDIHAKLDSIKVETGLQPTTLTLSLVSALAAIIATILIFRKLYKS